LTKDIYIQDYYQAQFQDPTLSASNVGPTSQVRTLAILL